MSASHVWPVEHPAAVPHIHDPDWQVSGDVHAEVPVPHTHWLFPESQVVPSSLFAHESAVPHLQTPESHVSPDTVHPDVSVPGVPQMHMLFDTSQVGAAVFVEHVAAVPHLHTPEEQVSSATEHVTDAHRSKKWKSGKKDTLFYYIRSYVINSDVHQLILKRITYWMKELVLRQ